MRYGLWKRIFAGVFMLLFSACGSTALPKMPEAHEALPTAAPTPVVTAAPTPTAIVTEAPTPAPTPEPTLTPEPTPDPDRPMVALTFDDGPNTANTGRVLDLLEQYGARATFFVLGANVTDESAYLLQRMSDLGCEIGIHGWDHWQMPALRYNALVERFENVKRVIDDSVEGGYVPKLMRPPGGLRDDNVRTAAKDCGLAVIMWSIDSRDWELKNPPKILDLCKKNMKNGAIVLFHDKLPTTYTTVEQLIPWLIEQGYELVTVSELLESRGQPVEPGAEYSEKIFD